MRCFSNCEEVELFLNDRSLGRKTMEKNSHLDWNVKYEPGTLLARAYSHGQAITADRVETTGDAAALQLVADRPAINADGEDVAVINVRAVDSRGRVVPTAKCAGRRLCDARRRSSSAGIGGDNAKRG